MNKKLLFAAMGFFLISNLAIAETAAFKDLESNVYDVQQLTKIGADYTEFSQHVTELGLVLERYEREMVGKDAVPYEQLFKEAAVQYLEALENLRKTLRTDFDQRDRDALNKVHIALRNHEIMFAAKKISDAEALKNSKK